MYHRTPDYRLNLEVHAVEKHKKGTCGEFTTQQQAHAARPHRPGRRHAHDPLNPTLLRMSKKSIYQYNYNYVDSRQGENSVEAQM